MPTEGPYTTILELCVENRFFHEQIDLIHDFPAFLYLTYKESLVQILIKSAVLVYAQPGPVAPLIYK